MTISVSSPPPMYIAPPFLDRLHRWFPLAGRVKRAKGLRLAHRGTASVKPMTKAELERALGGRHRGFVPRRKGYCTTVIEIRHETDERPPVVFVELSLESSRDLARLLGTAIGAGDVSLVVDLGDRTDASSDLLTVLHRTARHVRRLGGKLGVVSPQPSLRRLLDITLMSHAYAVFATRDEALRSWS